MTNPQYPAAGQPGQQPPQPAPQQPQGAPYGYPVAAPSSRYNVLAIVTIIAAFIVPIAGIITGHLSLKELRTSGEQGAGLAKAGLIISYVFTALITLLIIAYVVVIFGFFAYGISGGFDSY